MEQTNIFDVTKELTLKPLQSFALNEIREALKKSKRIIFQAACGFGKTILATQIAKSAATKGKRVVFITDRIILAKQSSDMFLSYGIDHGVIQAQNERFDIDQPVQVCNIQTIKRRGCPHADIYIIDEAHVIYSYYSKIMEENPKSYFLGITATPYSKGLGKLFDFHIEPIPIRELIRNKYLVDFDIYGPTVADLSKLKVRAGEFTDESVADTFDKVDIIGHVAEIWKKLAYGKKTIIFGANIAHIKHIVTQFQEIGISACQINAYQSEEERESAMNGFINGNTMVLCSVEVATRGFDHPAAECCILAIATKSMIKWTQTCGRVLRTSPGKNKAIIIDCGGNAERLGFFDDYEFLGLDDGKKKESKKAEPKEKLPKACPSCDFIKPVGVHVCPACGFAPEKKSEVEAADGSLEKLQRKAKKEYSIEEKQNFLAQLNQYAEDHNMRRGKSGMYGFAYYAFKDKFGVQPSGKINWSARAPVGEEVQRYMTYRNIRYAKRKVKETQPQPSL